MTERKEFEEFKRRVLSNPAARRAYIEAKIRAALTAAQPGDGGDAAAGEA